MAKQTSIWKKEIHLRRRPAPPTAVGPVAAPPLQSPKGALDPRFREVEGLGRLVEQYADEFPDRVDTWRKLVGHLGESAENGVLPAELDTVVCSLFRDLLRRDTSPQPSIWMKEITLRNLSDESASANVVPAAPQPPVQASVRGSEIAAIRSEAPVPDSARPEAEKTSVWKKEIYFRKGPEADQHRCVAEPERATEPTYPEPQTVSRPEPRSAPAEVVSVEKTSVWKKEISFRKGPKDEEPKLVVNPESASVEETRVPEETSVWKKEISFRKRSAAEEPELVVEPEVTSVPAVTGEPGLSATQSTSALAEALAAVLAPAPEPPAPAASAMSVPEPTSVWPSETSVPEAPPFATPEPRHSLAEAVAAVGESESEPPAPAASAMSVPEPTTVWPSETGVPEAPPFATPESRHSLGEAVAAVGAPEPEPAVPPGPLSVPDPHPVWETELTPIPPKAEQPATETVAAKAPRVSPPESRSALAEAMAVVAAPQLEPAVEAAPAPEKTSVWKKEISFGRKPKAERPEPVAAPKQSIEKPTSVLKKEITLRRKPKAEKPEPVAAPKQSVEKTSVLKKEISFRRKQKGVAESKAATGPKEPKPAKQRNESVLKRELTFPRVGVPRFRKRPAAANDVATVVGLRVGSSQLAAALIHNNGSAELRRLARSPLERGIVTAGEVRDSEALAKALKRFFSTHKLPRHGVRLGVATNRIGVRVLEVPANDDPKLFSNAIRFRAQDVVPIPLADAVLDHVALGKASDGRNERVLLVFAHRELVNGYVEACKRAAVKLAGIDFDAFALLRALSDREPTGIEKAAAVVVVAIGHERTIFAVSAGSVCDFARVLEWGGSSLDTALASALDIEPGEAELLKRTVSLSGGEDGGLGGVQLEAARAALRQEIQVLARELVSSLQFYQSRPDSLAIGEVLLTGGGAQLGGLDNELSQQLGVSVRRGDPLRHVSVAKGVELPAAIDSLAVAVGLGIEV